MQEKQGWMAKEKRGGRQQKKAENEAETGGRTARHPDYTAPM